MLYKTAEMKAYEKSFELQMLQYKYRMIEGDYAITAHVYYDSRRPDLGNAEKAVGDLLQRVGAVKNDRNCQEIHMYRHIDKVNPRIEFEITELWR